MTSSGLRSTRSCALRPPRRSSPSASPTGTSLRPRTRRSAICSGARAPDGAAGNGRPPSAVTVIRMSAALTETACRRRRPCSAWSGDAQLVLMGEASHGTHEFYSARAEMTRRLIEQRARMACTTGFLNGPGRPLDLSLHAWANLLPGQERDRAGKALRTTREDRVAEAMALARERKRKERVRAWKDEEHLRLAAGRKACKMPPMALPHLTSGEKATVRPRVRAFTMIDYLFRLRVKANYIDDELFSQGPENDTGAETFAARMQDIVAAHAACSRVAAWQTPRPEMGSCPRRMRGWTRTPRRPLPRPGSQTRHPGRGVKGFARCKSPHHGKFDAMVDHLSAQGRSRVMAAIRSTNQAAFQEKLHDVRLVKRLVEAVAGKAALEGGGPSQHRRQARPRAVPPQPAR